VKADTPKLQEIKTELEGSIELCRVDKPIETEEFEGVTNKEFNKCFENDLIE